MTSSDLIKIANEVLDNNNISKVFRNIIYESCIKTNTKLQEENERLKKQFPILENRICSLRRKNASLERKVDKMKNCLNCKHQTPKTKDDFLFCCECKQLDETKDNIILTKWELAE